MYLPAHFAEHRPEILHRLIRNHPLATLAWLGATVEADHIPLELVLPEREGLPLRLRGHVARANPLWRDHRAEAAVLAVFQGPELYISPSLYVSKAEHGKVVPTWNYVVVHARGQLLIHDDPQWLHALVSRLTDHHEQPRAQPWAVTDAPADYIAGLTRAIVGIEIVVTELQGKWKVSQNRPAADRASVVAGLAAGTDRAAADMAALVTGHAPDQIPSAVAAPDRNS